MSKNIGHFLAFNSEWFEKHQRGLLWLLNNRITKRWFRWILRIRKSDIGYDKEILEIQPNHYVVSGDRVGEFKADFRTHPKFGKRIYLAFKPIWWAIHAWDWLIADRFIPEWSYGFDTLTAYPDPDPETSTVDGKVMRDGVDESFATIRAGAGTTADPSGASPRVAIFATATTDQYSSLERFIALFDTSSIDDAATISAAVFSLFGFAKNEGITGQSVGIVASTPASNTNLVAADYAQLGTTRFATDITITAASDSAYNDFTLNATGIAAVSKTGITKLGVRLSCDIDNSAPTWVSGASARLNFRSADQVDVTNDPKLVVTYTTVVGPANVKTYNGLAAASVKTTNGLAIASVKTKNGLA